MMTSSAAEAGLRRAEWQAVIFGPRPTRRELLSLSPTWPTRAVRLRVHRNHAFEPVVSVLTPYLAFAGLAADVAYSDYDDSLTFATSGDADVEIVWLDFGRYAAMSGDELAAWVVGRLAALRALSPAPILLPDAADDTDVARAFNAEVRERAAAVPGVYVCDQAAIRAELGAAYFDDRAATAVGTRLSNAACVRTARAVGASWVPGALLPRLKALVLDLDNTLYEGVLGEDGPDGVRLTPAHAALQRRAVELGEQGIFLAVCSRNERVDVEALFAARPDFPLRPEHLSVMEISWAPKSTALQRIADALRIGTDALLFVDDNPGELAAVATELPAVKTLFAGPRAEDALAALAWYPGLHRWRVDEADALRARDLAAAKARAETAAQATDPDAYLRSLGARLEFARDVRGELDRLASLSAKTNQFNLSLRRLSPSDVDRFMSAPDHGVVSIRLRDRLSDSGIIGAVFTRRDGDALHVEELCISCRALGRDLEDVMVGAAVQAATADAEAPRAVVFHPVEGPRNRPALDWLARFAEGAAPDDAGRVTVAWEAETFGRLAARAPVTLEGVEGAAAATGEGR
jgi:FkbH-like protein